MVQKFNNILKQSQQYYTLYIYINRRIETYAVFPARQVQNDATSDYVFVFE